jgi:hypothetical protein
MKKSEEKEIEKKRDNALFRTPSTPHKPLKTKKKEGISDDESYAFMIRDL